MDLAPETAHCMTPLWMIQRYDRMTINGTDERGTVLLAEGVFVLVGIDAGHELTCTADALSWVGH